MKRLFPLLVLLFLGSGAFALEPGEALADTALEERARSLSKVLRCPVCQNESIDESSAPVAADLRMLVRERLLAGDTDREVIEHLVARYGDFVHFEPDRAGANLILWFSGPALALIGFIAVAAAYRNTPPKDRPLSEDEEAELAKLLVAEQDADSQR